MTTAAQQHANQRELDRGLEKDLWGQLRGLGVGALLTKVAGAGAPVIGIFLDLMRSRLETMRQLAERMMEQKYGDTRIVYLGEQATGIDLTSEKCWDIVHAMGGTIWVQHVDLTASEGLSLVVFYHPDADFKVDPKDAIRVYRHRNVCTVNDGPQLRAAAR